VDYILWSRSDQHATAGKAAEWARGRATLAAEFLAGFGMSPDPGGAPARAEALAPLFEGLPPGAARREDVRRDLEAVRRLHALASAAAGTYEARKGKPREPDGPLLDLFVSVTIAYLRSVGGRLGKSDVAPASPLVRFVQAAMRVMVTRLPYAMDINPKHDTGAVYALRSCVNSQDSVRHRYRAMRAARKERASKPGMAERSEKSRRFRRRPGDHELTILTNATRSAAVRARAVRITR
jgi:hypothetical protein